MNLAIRDTNEGRVKAWIQSDKNHIYIEIADKLLIILWIISWVLRGNLSVRYLEYTALTYALWCRGGPCSGSCVTSSAGGTAGLVVQSLIRSQSTIHTLLICVIPVSTRRACHWNIYMIALFIKGVLHQTINKTSFKIMFSFCWISSNQICSGKPWNRHLRQIQIGDSNRHGQLLPIQINQDEMCVSNYIHNIMCYIIVYP